MNKGQMVKLKAYGNKEVIMRLIRQEGDTLIVCTPQEYDIASREGREPEGIGWHIDFFLGEYTDKV